MPQVKLFSRWGSLFSGETGEYPDEVAAMLVAEKRGKRVLENGDVEPWSDESNEDQPGVPIMPIESKIDSGFAIDATKDPFILDGLDEATATALHVAGLHTPGDVEAYLGGETKDAKFSKPVLKKITELYGLK